MTGFPWSPGDALLAADLNAAIANAGGTAAQIVLTQTVVTLAPGTDLIVAPARARRYLAIMNIDRSDATLAFDATATAGSGWILTAAYTSGAQGGGMTWAAGEGVPTNAVHAISTGGTRLVVLEGI